LINRIITIKKTKDKNNIPVNHKKTKEVKKVGN